MSIEKMKRLSVLTLRSGSDELLRQMQRLGCVEMSEVAAPTEETAWRKAETGQLAPLRDTVQELMHCQEIFSQHLPKQKGLLRVRPVLREKDFFDDAAFERAKQIAHESAECDKQISALSAERQKLSACCAEYEPWKSLDIPLNMQDTENLHFHFGTMPTAATLEDIGQAAGELGEAEQVSSDKEVRYLLLTNHRAAEEETMSALKSLGWVSVSFRECCGTAEESIRELTHRMDEAQKEIALYRKRLDELAGHQEMILQAIDRAALELSREENRSKLLESEKTAYLEGWVPEHQWPKLRRLISEQGCAWECRVIEESEYGETPVKLSNNVLTRPLNMVTEMYSLPAYGTIDPNPLMAPFFILFYGIMMADVGYGLLMILAALIIKKKYKPKDGMAHFFSLLLECGIATFLMGILTGGFFGDFLTQLVTMISPEKTFTLPKLIDPLDDIMMILIGSLCLGLIQIITGMAVSLVEKCRHKFFADALFEEVTWWIVFAGIALACLNRTKLVLWLGCALVLLGPIVQGKGMGKLTGIFASLYNHVTGYFGDVLSYSRLMALMLAGSVIAQVFNMLGTLTGNVVLYIVIAMLGNALNFALNLLGCYVHDLRLQCLEFFGKFYVDGGKPFRPLSYQTKYYDIETE